MKTRIFIVKVIVFALLLIGMDLLAGLVFRVLQNRALEHSPYGMVTKYTLEKVDSDIVIIGGSEANHSYVCSIIEDSMHLSTYNCGLDGCGFWYQNAMINGILDRYAPRYIIWSVLPDYLSPANSTGDKGITELKPYYRSNEFCKMAILHKSRQEGVKMLSNLYAYNSKLFDYIYMNVFPDYLYDHGYAPLYGSAKGLGIKSRTRNGEVDSVSVMVFDGTLQRCRDMEVNVILVMTPRFEKGNYHLVNFFKMKEIAQKNRCCIIDDFFQDSEMMVADYFRDNAHLNDDGAKAFTRELCGLIENEY